MRVEFNKNSFSANLCEEPQMGIIHLRPNEERLMKNNKAMLFGILALFIAFVNLPFGIFMNFSTEFLTKIFNANVTHWVSYLFLISVSIFAASILCGVFSIVFFTKSQKKFSDAMGLTFSVFSFIISTTGLILSILGLCAF